MTYRPTHCDTVPTSLRPRFEGRRRPSPMLLAAWIMSLLALVVSGCRIAVPPTATPPPPPPTGTPTVPFPTLIPTATLTPAPTPTPTPDLFAGLGEVLYEEQFQSIIGWDLGEDQAGGTSLTDSGLVIAVREPYAFRFARSPAPDLSDFYLEVRLRADLCSSGDSFGVAFRVTPRGDHYRFTLTCDGGARVLRSRAGSLITLLSTNHTDAVISGAPSSNHLTIVALANTFHFFINELEVFSMRDTGLSQGGLGLFVQSSQAGQTTVTYQYMLAREVIP